MADRDSKNDPYRSYRFRLEIDGVDWAGFRECSGLDFSHEPVDYREGSDPFNVRKPPKLTKYSNITLKWGRSHDKQLWEWRQEAAEGQVASKDGSIILLNDAGEENMRWNFTAGWPAKCIGRSFNATGDDVVIETLEIVHEGLKKI